MSFVSNNKKPIIIGTLVLALVGILFLGLGLGGVFDIKAPPTTDAPPSFHPQPGTHIPGVSRIECLPDVQNVTPQLCFERGCSWEELKIEGESVPVCYVNPDLHGYDVTYAGPVSQSSSSLNDRLYHLTRLRSSSKLYSTPFVAPQLRVQRKTKETLNFKFFDAAKERYEVPIPLEKLKDDGKEALYEFRQTSARDTGIQIVRKSTQTVLFDMQLGGLFLENQFLQITTKLPTSYVYGFGDNRHNTLRHKMDWKTWPMFARDAPPQNNGVQQNLYGVHPFYICVEDDGNAFGVFLLNSNAMEYRFQPDPALTLRSIGGVFDFYVFLGPTPEDVIRQYTDLLGKTFIPPYWGLGFQISRWGFQDLDHVKRVVDRMTLAQIPLDAVYGDIDYMEHRQDFTYDKVNYGGLPDYIDHLHDVKKMKYVIILDPAIHVDAEAKHPGNEWNPYTAYTEAVEKDIFVKWPERFFNGTTPMPVDAGMSVGPKRSMLGKVWPDGRSAFPDFFQPETLKWWEKYITKVYVDQGIKFDALWLDMNEVSSFDTNENASRAWYCNKPDELPGNHTCFALQCPKDDLLDNPPYNPAAARNWARTDPNHSDGLRLDTMLSDKTLCMVGEVKIKGKIHTQYDVHNLYGYSQAEVSYRVAQNIRKERSFVFSRSTFPGTQKYVGHWGGDNEATFADLRYSLINLLEYSMFGFSYVGSDICGFFKNTTIPLCKKWSVAGAFYPFARNHNGNIYGDQDPARFPEVAEAAKAALEIRYTLLPYLYTLFYRAHVYGETVNRPLHHVYPKNVAFRDVDDQYFWGSALMISPFLDEADRRTVVYPTDETLYDYYDGTPTNSSNGPDEHTWKAQKLGSGYDKPRFVPLHLRPGFIIPTQDHAVTTVLSRLKPFRLLIVADEKHPIAKGQLFFDDGKSIDTVQSGKYLKVDFEYNYFKKSFKLQVLHMGYDLDSDELATISLEELKIYAPNTFATGLEVHLNGSLPEPDAQFTVSGNDKITYVGGRFPLSQYPYEISLYQPTASNLDCAPDASKTYVTRSVCEARGCIWTGSYEGSPYCAFPKLNKIGYAGRGVLSHNTEIALTANTEAKNARPNAHPTVNLKVQEISDNVVRITFTGTKTTDPAKSRPVPKSYAEFAHKAYANPAADKKYNYELLTKEDGTAHVRVTRVSTGTVIFDTSGGPLIYANQFREITTKLPSDYVYGIGEHSRDSFRHKFDKHRTWGMFARDQPPGGPQNLYGTHPYVQVVEDNAGHAYGMLLLNAHAMEATFTTVSDTTDGTPIPVITYRTIGGNLDFFLVVGDNPKDVNARYMDLIGRPFLPPYWALGFQISRYGYNTFEKMRAAVERTIDAKIPLDVFYGDIDYFEGEMDFTISEERFKELPAYVEQKLEEGVKFVTIQDPCIAAVTSQEPFVRGLDDKYNENVFIKWPKGYVDPNLQSYKSFDPSQPEYLLGHVWPGDRTVFIDFFNKDAHAWWTEEIKRFHERIKYSALWIDMNEPASFGTNGFDVWYDYSPIWPWALQCPNQTTANLDYLLDMPPYIPKSLDTPSGRISDKTICMTAEQKDSDDIVYSHYEVHNLYGHSQIAPSLKAMQEVTKKRSFVFSRSTFVGSGTGAGHWLGDNSANYEQLAQSVIGIMEFNIFGIPYVGADICGFFGNSDPQLCIRWMQLGAFYPFSRNHNGKDNIDQDPAFYVPITRVAEASKKAVDRRYRLLPYLYTLMSDAHLKGHTVVRSLMEEFPTDLKARAIDQQFMWGSALLITPVLKKDVSFVEAYFPAGDWYEFETGAHKPIAAAGATERLPVNLMSIPLHIRGGSIIPMQESGPNTQTSSKSPYTLLIAPTINGASQTASGTLFWDDGDKIRVAGESEKTDFTAKFTYSLATVTGRITATVTIDTNTAEAALERPQVQKLNTLRIAGYPASSHSKVICVRTRVNNNTPLPATTVKITFNNEYLVLDNFGFEFEPENDAANTLEIIFSDFSTTDAPEFCSP